MNVKGMFILYLEQIYVVNFLGDVAVHLNVQLILEPPKDF